MAGSDRSLIGLLKRHYVWIPLLPLIMAVILLMVGSAQRETADALDNTGVQVNATVLNARSSQQRDPDGTMQTRYRLQVRFAPQLGDPVEGWHDVNRATFETAEIGEILPIRYLPADPRTIEFSEGSTRRSGWLFSLVGSVFLIASLGAGYAFGRHIPSARRAQLSQQRRRASVQAHENSGIKLGDTHLHRMIWADDLGDTGQSRARKPGDLPRIGESIMLRVDPKTDRGWWEGDL